MISTILCVVWIVAVALLLGYGAYHKFAVPVPTTGALTVILLIVLWGISLEIWPTKERAWEALQQAQKNYLEMK